MIPEGYPDSDQDDITWLIEAKSEIDGVDLDISFEIPVFDVKGSYLEEQFQAVVEVAEKAEEIKKKYSFEEMLRNLQQRKVKVQHKEGMIRLKFGPARHIGLAIGVTFFTAIWTAITVFLAYKAPILFPIFFPNSLGIIYSKRVRL